MKTKILGLCGCLAVALTSLAAPAQHTVTATLNYDFTSDNACSATVITGCLKQFNIYDLSGAAPVKFGIPRISRRFVRLAAPPLCWKMSSWRGAIALTSSLKTGQPPL